MFGGLDREAVESQIAKQCIRSTSPLVVDELVELDEREVRKCGGVALFCHRADLLVRRGGRLRLRCQMAPPPSRDVRYR